ncbi:MAG: hypothetical protein WBB25_10860 [Sulfitobacter sp.]
MIRILISGALVVGLAGCGDLASRFGLGAGKKAGEQGATAPIDPFVASASEVGEATLAPETAAPPPPAAAKTAEALDTTTPAQRAAAAAPAKTPTKALGKTVATLGSPTEPGLWLKTPLVTTEQQGRVTNPANGKSSLVTLIPIDGPATAGSRMSLAALRIIEASLTDLTEIEVSLAN